METPPRIAGLEPTLEQLIRREYTDSVNAGVQPQMMEQWLRLAVLQCGRNARALKQPHPDDEPTAQGGES